MSSVPKAPPWMAADGQEPMMAIEGGAEDPGESVRRGAEPLRRLEEASPLGEGSKPKGEEALVPGSGPGAIDAPPAGGGATLAWALAYARRGWAVFPVHGVLSETGACTCGAAHLEDRDKGKHPVLNNGVKGATKEERKIREWWGSEEGARWNIGIRTGDISGITVLDVDVGPGKLGAETWAKLIEKGGEPNTLMAATGSGGTHAFFRYNSALKTSSNTLGPGVDCRNDGGYVVAAPSRHGSGRRYEWMGAATVAEFELEELAALPAHLSQRIETRGRPKGSGRGGAGDDGGKVGKPKKKWTLDEVRKMLEHVDPGDRDRWRAVGIILGREFGSASAETADAAWEAYVEWSDGWDGPKGRNHEGIMREAFYELSQQEPRGGAGELSIGTIVNAAMEGGWVGEVGPVDPSLFVYFGPGNDYIYRPTMQHWAAEAVNAACGRVLDDAGNIVKATVWVQKKFLATSQTHHPDVKDFFTRGRDSAFGDIFDSPGAALVNTYRPPTIPMGDSAMAGPFLEHVARVFSKEGDADQFLNYMAHRAQRPGEKPRFALLIAGEQGTGKDTSIEFCLPAIGRWNCANIEPSAFEGSFNEYAASTLVRISETSNLHEMNRWAFNETTKVLIAGNPDSMTVNPKYGKKFDVRLYCGVILTTNHLSTGIYIPPDDRRYDVIDCATKAEMGLAEDEARRRYFEDLWGWFSAGGDAHVAAFLHERDLTGWSAANGQRKTAAHRHVVQAGMGSDAWLVDALDALAESGLVPCVGEGEARRPALVRGDWLLEEAAASGDYSRKELNARMIASMQRAGYTKLPNHATSDGRWRLGKKLTVVYVLASEMTPLQAIQRIRELDKVKF